MLLQLGILRLAPADLFSKIWGEELEYEPKDEPQDEPEDELEVEAHESQALGRYLRLCIGELSLKLIFLCFKIVISKGEYFG